METLRFVWRSSRKSALLILTVFAAATAGITGCDDSLTSVGEDELAPPLGLRGITGNTQVTLIWFTSNFESDFEGYIVFQDSTGDRSTDGESTTLPSGFTEVPGTRIELNSSGAPIDVNINNLTNGRTYSFAVCAFRDGGSEISRTSNIIAETPRPDIPSVILSTATTNDVPGPPADDTQAGFDFDGFDVETVPSILGVPNDYVNGFGTDVVHEAFDPSGTANIRSWMAGMNGGGVQDLGSMVDLDGSDVAPEEGYAGQGESVLLTVGHVYAVQTGELPPRYGKFIVTQIDENNRTVRFNAAFQTKDDDPNYFPALGIKEP